MPGVNKIWDNHGTGKLVKGLVDLGNGEFAIELFDPKNPNKRVFVSENGTSDKNDEIIKMTEADYNKFGRRIVSALNTAKGAPSAKVLQGITDIFNRGSVPGTATSTDTKPPATLGQSLQTTTQPPTDTPVQHGQTVQDPEGVTVTAVEEQTVENTDAIVEELVGEAAARYSDNIKLAGNEEFKRQIENILINDVMERAKVDRPTALRLIGDARSPKVLPQYQGKSGAEILGGWMGTGVDTAMDAATTIGGAVIDTAVEAGSGLVRIGSDFAKGFSESDSPPSPQTSQASQASQAPYGGTRLLDINNPTGLRISKDKWVGLSQQQNDSDFATFDTAEDGIRAGARTLSTYSKEHGLNTVEGIIKRWAPATENNTQAYIADVANRLGVKPTDKIDVIARRGDLLEAIINHENGQQPFARAMIDAQVARADSDLTPTQQKAVDNGVGTGNLTQNMLDNPTMQQAVDQSAQDLQKTNPEKVQKQVESGVKAMKPGKLSNKDVHTLVMMKAAKIIDQATLNRFRDFGVMSKDSIDVLRTQMNNANSVNIKRLELLAKRDESDHKRTDEAFEFLKKWDALPRSQKITVGLTLNSSEKLDPYRKGLLNNSISELLSEETNASFWDPLDLLIQGNASSEKLAGTLLGYALLPDGRVTALNAVGDEAGDRDVYLSSFDKDLQAYLKKHLPTKKTAQLQLLRAQVDVLETRLLEEEGNVALQLELEEELKILYKRERTLKTQGDN
jgi:hypothetical protein